MLVIT